MKLTNTLCMSLLAVLTAGCDFGVFEPDDGAHAPGASTNVAEGKQASQSSLAYGGDPARAVDGNTNGRWRDRSVTHTANTMEPSWRVDLGGAHRLDSVTLWNRTDCCSARLSNFHVDYLDAAGNVIATRDHPGQVAGSAEIELSASGVHAVVVQLYGKNFLSLAEVQVWGAPQRGDAVHGVHVAHYSLGDDTSRMPNYDALTPDAQGQQDNIDLAAYAGTNQFGMVFWGHLHIEDAGAYTFQTVSDDGSILYIDGRRVVDNDGRHGARARTGNATLSAGYHPFVLEFFEHRGGEVLQLTYRRGGGEFVPGPDSMLFLSEPGSADSCPDDPDKTEPGACGCGTPDTDTDTDRTPDCRDQCPTDPNKTEPGSCGCGTAEDSCGGETSPGLLRRYYRGEWNALPDLDALSPDHVDIASAVILGPYADTERFALMFTGEIRIDGAGLYEFELGSDDGSRLIIDGRVVVDNDGLHGFATKIGSIDLTEGMHDLRVEYFERTGGDRLRLRYRPSGGSFVEVPASVLSHAGGPVTTAGPLDKAGDTKLRIGSWNNHRGSVFPKTDSVWRAINSSGKYHVLRTEGAARIFRAVDADIWLLQETVYTNSGLPDGVTVGDINRKIAGYMNSVTGDSWRVSCNGKGLCALLRGDIRFDGTWSRGGRVAAHRVILPDGTRLAIINVHYMNLGQAEDTRDLVNLLESTVSAIFVGGDFNNGPGDGRYNEIDGIPGMNVLSMSHWQDPNATHVSSAMASRVHRNTKGYVKYGGGAPGHDLVTSISGGHIDHFFLKSNTWRAGNRLVLNTMLFAPETLNDYDLSPLDVALQPQLYQSYFADFLTDGVVYDIPANAYDSDRGMDHDHLPMVVDFTWP